jgi:hypothetical protein
LASPNFRINGNAVGVPANVSASSTVTATLDSTDGVRQVEWSIASTDEATDIGDYTLVQSGSVGQTVTTTSLVAGTAARLRCRINGGVNLSTGLNDPNGTNAYGKFGVPTAAGFMVGCIGETTEQDATSGWTSLVNPIIRVTPAAAPVSSVSGTAPIVSSGGATPAISITAASGGSAGSMSAAHYTLVNAATSSPTADTMAKRTASTALLQASGFTNGSGIKASAATVRGGASETIAAFRDFANSMDIPALYTDGSDRVLIGSGVASCGGVTLDANGSTGYHDISIDASPLLRVGPGEVSAYSDVTVVGLKTAATGSTITSASTLDTTQSTVYVDAAGGSFSLALPAAATVAGRIWTIVKITAANTVTLDAAGTEKINGALTYAITTQWSSITIQAVNKPLISEWIVIATA